MSAVVHDAVSANATGGVVVLGYSMGTAIAEYVVLHRTVAGLILSAPWNDFIVAEQYGDSKTAYVLARDATRLFDEVAMVRRIHAPCSSYRGPWTMPSLRSRAENSNTPPLHRDVAPDVRLHCRWVTIAPCHSGATMLPSQ